MHAWSTHKVTQRAQCWCIWIIRSCPVRVLRRSTGTTGTRRPCKRRLPCVVFSFGSGFGFRWCPYFRSLVLWIAQPPGGTSGTYGIRGGSSAAGPCNDSTDGARHCVLLCGQQQGALYVQPTPRMNTADWFENETHFSS